jgi:dihydropteroate synthase
MYTLNCKGRLLQLDEPKVMGIINVTPDSFFAGSRVMDVSAVLQQAQKMLYEGATFIDVGGLSTRPGSLPVEPSEEIQRVVPAINAIINAFPEAIISIDTYRSSVAKEAVSAGALIVNDVSAGNLDEAMLDTVAALGVPFIATHMKGNPENMQTLAHYEDVAREVLDYLILKIEACKKAGINDVIVDPGFGFAKTIEHNFELLQKLEVFKILERPLLFGISRKSTIYKTLDLTNNEALNGTTVLNTIALMKGATILRVHDVKEAVEAVKLYKNVMKAF